MNLTRVYDFIQVIHIKRSYSTKYDYFCTHILFTTIYLQQRQKLKHNKYSEQKINMSYFTPSKDYDMNMHAKIQCMHMHVFL
jgi:hypothetical protein